MFADFVCGCSSLCFGVGLGSVGLLVMVCCSLGLVWGGLIFGGFGFGSVGWFKDLLVLMRVEG